MYQKVDTNMNLLEREKKRKNSGEIIIFQKEYGDRERRRNLYVL